MTIAEQIISNKIVAIIRGADAGAVAGIIDALQAGGINSVEITLNSPGAIELIAATSKRKAGEMLIGAGTVLTEEEVRKVVDAGAQFIISPTLDPAVIATTKKLNRASIPGAFTPTEILAAYRAGADIIKVFPASIGSQYIKDLRGPLPYIPLMPTGGVHLQNIKEFFDAGAVAAGIGSALVYAKKNITDDYLEQLKTSAALFVKAVNSTAEKN